MTDSTPEELLARKRAGGFTLFKPILVGADARDRLIACIGAIAGIGLAGLVSTMLFGVDLHLPLLAAPLGASAVIVFALPSSPIGQPWPVIGGNTISALTGILIGDVVSEPMLAAGLAVGIAIGMMSLTRSLHPPGGAMALTAAIGGPAVQAAGFGFAFVPVCLNSVLLVALALVFHKFSGHPYGPAPRKPAPPPRLFTADDIDAAIEEMGETFDIKREDLDRLLVEIENRSRQRRGLR